MPQDHEYTFVRGIMVSRQIIEDCEQETGGKLIPDREGELLLGLDEAIYEYYRLKGELPPNKTIRVGTDEYVFRNIPLEIGAEIYETRGPKKMWFKRRVIF